MSASLPTSSPFPGVPPAPAPEPPSQFDQVFGSLADAYLKIKLAKAAAKQNGKLPTQAQNLAATNPQSATEQLGISNKLLIGGGVVVVLLVAFVALRRK